MPKGITFLTPIFLQNGYIESTNLFNKLDPNIESDVSGFMSSMLNAGWNFYDKSQNLFRAQKYDDALIACNEGLKKNPQSIHFIALQCEIFLAKKAYPEALNTILNSSIDWRGRDVVEAAVIYIYFIRQAHNFAAISKWDEVKKICDRASLLKASLFNYYYGLGDGTRTFYELLDKGVTFEEHLVLRAYSLANLKNYEKCFTELDGGFKENKITVEKLNNKDVPGRENIISLLNVQKATLLYLEALVLYEKKNYDTALLRIKEAMSMHLGQEDYHELHKKIEAEKLKLKKSEIAIPNLLQRREELLASGDDTAAEKLMSVATQDFPEDLELLYLEGKGAFMAGNHVKAVNSFQKLISLNKNKDYKDTEFWLSQAWGKFDGGKIEFTRQEKNELLKSLDLIGLPSVKDFAVMSRESYKDKGGTPPPGWEILFTSDKFGDSLSKTGYFGVAYRNKTSKCIVIAHRGTDPRISELLKGKDLKSDLDLLLKNIPNSFEDAVKFTHNVMNEIKRSGGQNYFYAHTGHSLGGATATYCANKLQQKATVFDPPGSYDIIAQTKGGKFNDNGIDVTTYVSRPNFINTTGKQVGEVIRIHGVSINQKLITTDDSVISLTAWANKVLPAFLGKTLDAGIIIANNINSHSIDAITAAIDDDSGEPISSSVVIMWPSSVNDWLSYEKLLEKNRGIDDLNNGNKRKEEYKTSAHFEMGDEANTKRISFSRFSPKAQVFLDKLHNTKKALPFPKKLPDEIRNNFKIETSGKYDKYIVISGLLTATEFQAYIEKYVSEIEAKKILEFSPTSAKIGNTTVKHQDKYENIQFPWGKTIQRRLEILKGHLELPVDSQEKTENINYEPMSIKK